jgi:aldose 1-epimerase
MSGCHEQGLIVLRDDHAEVGVAPAWGGALTWYNWLPGANNQRTPILRPWSPEGNETPDPFSLASNVMVPWCNRIGGNGFMFEGRYYPVKPNVANQPFAIHGDGFSSAWTVTQLQSTKVQMTLESSALAAFVYTAQLSYELKSGALCMTLAVTNCADEAAPYGVGFHPWFAKRHDTQLQFDSEFYWTESKDFLPLKRIACYGSDARDFKFVRPVPNSWTNTAYEGWSHKATVCTPSLDMTVHIEASDSLDNLMVYSPNASADFVCVEPMSHIPNAHRLHGLAKGAKLSRLETGQTLEGSMWIRPSRTGCGPPLVAL